MIDFSENSFPGNIVLEVSSLKALPGKAVKKAHVNISLLDNKTDRIIDEVKSTCSYSIDGSVLLPKDSRSTIEFSNIQIGNSIKVRIDVVVKSMFSKKVICSYDSLLSALYAKTTCHFSPSGEAALKITITPILTPQTSISKEAKVNSSNNENTSESNVISKIIEKVLHIDPKTEDNYHTSGIEKELFSVKSDKTIPSMSNHEDESTRNDSLNESMKNPSPSNVVDTSNFDNTSTVVLVQSNSGSASESSVMSVTNVSSNLLNQQDIKTSSNSPKAGYVSIDRKTSDDDCGTHYHPDLSDVQTSIEVSPPITSTESLLVSSYISDAVIFDSETHSSNDVSYDLENTSSPKLCEKKPVMKKHRSEETKKSRRKSIGMKSTIIVDVDTSIVDTSDNVITIDESLPVVEEPLSTSDILPIEDDSIATFKDDGQPVFEPELESNDNHEENQEDVNVSTRDRRRRTSIGSNRKHRLTFSTKKHVPHWDEGGTSVADTVKATMEERIRADSSDIFDEFANAGSSPGIEAWVIDNAELRQIDENEIGAFYNADSYILLHTRDCGKGGLAWTVHTWIGSNAAGDKSTIAAFKAKTLTKFLGGARLIQNREGEESDDMIEMLYGNINVVEGATAKSSLRNSQLIANSTSIVRLLLVASDASDSAVFTQESNTTHVKASAPFLKTVPLIRSSLQSNRALILDSGGSVIYQWRGTDASHIARAKLFEATFSLRAERIQQFANCKIQVVDEGSEPREFWELFDSRVTEEVDEKSLSDIENNSQFEVDVNIDKLDSTDNFKNEDYIYVDESADGSCDSELSDMEDDDIEYDMKDIEEYCHMQSQGHSELIRRRVASRSRVLSPSVVDDAENLKSDDKREISPSLYRVGYTNSELHSSRLSGTNSDGEYCGPLTRDLLERNGVYILDCEEEVYLWIGKYSSADIRSAALKLAEALIQHSKSSWVQVVTVHDSNEPILFKSKFPGWVENDMRIAHPAPSTNLSPKSLGSSSSRKLLNAVNSSANHMMKDFRTILRKQSSYKRKNSQSSSSRTLCRSVAAPTHQNDPLNELLKKDDGTGVVIVWVITDKGLQVVARENHGHFWTHETYVILYGFKYFAVNEKSGEESELSDFVFYFWQGYHSREKAYPQWKLEILPKKREEWINQMGKLPVEIKVMQGVEPIHFFKVFKHKYIVHYAFLNILRRRAKALQNAEAIQEDILRNERLRSSYMPPRRYLLRSPSLAVSPPKRQADFLQKSFGKGSIRSLDSSIAESVVSAQTRLDRPSKSVFHQELTAGVLLFHIRGQGLCKEDVHAVQIEALSNRLNSSDCFVALRPLASGELNIWLWVGRGSELYEQEAAANIAQRIQKWFGKTSGKSEIRVVEEGVEELFDRWIVKSFYRALGGYDLYTNFDLLKTPRDIRPHSLRYPTLFTCDISKGVYSVTTIGRRFSQLNLSSTCSAILDAHFAIFIWHGRDSSSSLRVTSARVAKKFMGSLKHGAHIMQRKPIDIYQDFEPSSFTSCFHGWCEWSIITKQYIDPRQVRLDVRKKLGLLGDMVTIMGRPITGISAEEAKLRIEKIKERDSRLKKKKENSNDVIRERIRLQVIKNITSLPPPSSSKDESCQPPIRKSVSLPNVERKHSNIPTIIKTVNKDINNSNLNITDANNDTTDVNQNNNTINKSTSLTPPEDVQVRLPKSPSNKTQNMASSAGSGHTARDRIRNGALSANNSNNSKKSSIPTPIKIKDNAEFGQKVLPNSTINKSPVHNTTPNVNVAKALRAAASLIPVYAQHNERVVKCAEKSKQLSKAHSNPSMHSPTKSQDTSQKSHSAKY